jgi:hypothetical protein
VKLDVEQTNNWQFSEENAAKQSYNHTNDVEVPPGKSIRIDAQVTKGKLNVPYRALICAEDGSKQWIQGIWNGVSTANLVVKQMDI